MTPTTSRARRAVLAALTALALTAVLPPSTATAAAATGDRPGDIVSARPSRFLPNPLTPSSAKAWTIRYRSTSATGAPNVVSGTVLVPDDGRTGRRPLVSYAVGTVGLAAKCAPSTGFPTGTTVEGNLINQALLRGWAVAVTDYELVGDPGVETYAVGSAEGQAVLDAARAAERLPGTGLDADSPVGIMGYSQGGQAAAWAAELHRDYAPDLAVQGTAAGGVPADLLKVADHNDGNVGAGLILMAGVGHDTAYPQLDLAKYLNARGRYYVNLDKTRCVAEDTVAGAFRTIAEVTVTNPLDQPDWQRRLRADRLGGHAPDAPVYLYQATADELIPYSVAAGLRREWCAAGATVWWRELPLLGHVEGAVAGSPLAMDWLAQRFAGRAAQGNC